MAYQHDNLDRNLMGIQNSMEYNVAGEPALRVIANANGWGIQVSSGEVDGVSYIEKFGYQTYVPNGDIATVWDGTGLYDYLTTATTVTVTSDDPDDNPAGSGARSVEIQGLDQDHNVVLETVDLGGTSITTFIRVFRVRVCVSGNTNPNEGIITIAGGGKTLAQIGKLANNADGHGQTNMAIYTVPAGKTSNHVGYFGDLMATAADLAGVKTPEKLDSVSISPVLFGKDSEQQQHDFVYWEFYEMGGIQALRQGKWKAVRTPMFTGPVQIYDITKDLGEKNDLADQYPELAAKFDRLMNSSHTPDPRWVATTGAAGRH